MLHVPPLADMNWDTSGGAPFFVTEPSGDEIRRARHAWSN
jgi:hypothetical protein